MKKFRVLRIVVLPAVLALLAAALGSQAVEPTLAVTEHPELGEILVDGDGRSVYAFARDEEGESSCYDECAEVWPPLIVSGAVGFEDSIDLGLLDTIEREDASLQLTYAGHPLYSFEQDEKEGDIAGHGVNNEWFLLSPTGDLVEAKAEEVEEEAGAGEAEPEAQEAAAEGDLPFEEKMKIGAGVFRRICSQCHGAEGDDPQVAHAVVLAGNERYVGRAERVIRTVLKGNGYMPSFGDQLSDEEVASVVTFIRNSWGNDFAPVSIEEVREQR